MKRDLSDIEFIQCCKNTSEHVIQNNVIFPLNIPEVGSRMQRREKQNIEVTKIIVSKQQPDKPKKKIYPIVPEYIPKVRVYKQKTDVDK